MIIKCKGISECRKQCLVETDRDAVREIDLEHQPGENEIQVVKYIRGHTHIYRVSGPYIDVVIIRSCGALVKNENTLPHRPFVERMCTRAILLVRMDENSEHVDFTLNEYLSFRDERVSVQNGR